MYGTLEGGWPIPCLQSSRANVLKRYFSIHLFLSSLTKHLPLKVTPVRIEGLGYRRLGLELQSLLVKPFVHALPVFCTAFFFTHFSFLSHFQAKTFNVFFYFSNFVSPIARCVFLLFCLYTQKILGVVLGIAYFYGTVSNSIHFQGVGHSYNIFHIMFTMLNTIFHNRSNNAVVVHSSF